MKRLTALILCCALLFSVVPCSFSAAAEPSELETVLNYIDNHVTATENGDGSVTYQLNTGTDRPALPPQKGGNVQTQEPLMQATAKPLASATVSDYTYTTNQSHTPVALEQRYLYAMLDEEWQGYYRQIDTAVRNLDATLTINADLLQNDRYRLYFLYMFDTPELFYLSAQIVVRYAQPKTFVFSYAVGSTAGNYHDYNSSTVSTALRQKIINKKQTFDNAVNRVVATIPADAPDIVKEVLLYNSVQRMGYYNMDAINYNLWDNLANDNWTAYGILVNGKGVCESYAELFQTLCNAVGIECTSVAGDAGGPHKWNAVKIDGEWYQCDPTFDDPYSTTSTEVGHDYFNLTNRAINELEHLWPENTWPQWDGNYWPVPDCAATTHSWSAVVALYGNDPNTLHRYAGPCDTTCDGCGQTRAAANPNQHAFANPSSTFCAGCGVTRRVTLSHIEITKMPTKVFYTIGDEFDPRGMEVTAYFNTGSMAVSDYTYSGYTPTLGEKTITVFYNGKTASFTVTVREERNGWFFENNHWYFFQKNVPVTNTWKADTKGWVYLGADGAMKTNAWVRDSVGWCYVGADGYCVTNCWKRDGNGWCYLDSNGRMTTNAWVRDSQGWCFVDASGYCVTDKWARDSKGWCYLGTDGRMVTNRWVRDSVGWCYIGADGYAVTNCWKRDSVGWCYLNSEGSMTKASWVYDGGHWYYLNANGYMVTGRQYIGGKVYYFSNSGIWLE